MEKEEGNFLDFDLHDSMSGSGFERRHWSFFCGEVAISGSPTIARFSGKRGKWRYKSGLGSFSPRSFAQHLHVMVHSSRELIIRPIICHC